MHSRPESRAPLGPDGGTMPRPLGLQKMSFSDGALRKPDPESSSKVSAGGPFFTVLVPTMNRFQLLESAVGTIMRQTFTDFELIVSDNSSDEESKMRNRATVEEFADDSRVRYIRPDRWMNMPDHWEFATRHASGRYVVILTDRHVMRPSALQFLHVQINHLQEDSKVVSWQPGSAFSRSGTVNSVPFTGASEVLDSMQELCEFAKCAQWRFSPIWHNRLPRMLNSCYRFDVAQTIRKNHGRLFMPSNPDYTCAYLLLAYTDRFTYLDRPLFMHHGNQGNGNNILLYGGKEYISSLGDEDLSAELPVPLRTATNLIIRDLLMIKNLVGTRLSNISLDLVGYFMCNYRELMIMERLGSQVDVRALYAQWSEGIQMLTTEQQKQIEVFVSELERERSSFTSLRRLAVKLGFDRHYHAIVGGIRHIRRLFTGKPVYPNVLDAARQTDYMLTDAVDKQGFSKVCKP